MILQSCRLKNIFEETIENMFLLHRNVRDFFWPDFNFKSVLNFGRALADYFRSVTDLVAPLELYFGVTKETVLPHQMPEKPQNAPLFSLNLSCYRLCI